MFWVGSRCEVDSAQAMRAVVQILPVPEVGPNWDKVLDAELGSEFPTPALVRVCGLMLAVVEEPAAARACAPAWEVALVLDREAAKAVRRRVAAMPGVLPAGCGRMDR